MFLTFLSNTIGSVETAICFVELPLYIKDANFDVDPRYSYFQAYFIVCSLLHVPRTAFSQDVVTLNTNNKDVAITNRIPNDDDAHTGNIILDSLAHLGMVYALAPQQIQKFPPEVVPQPGDILGGAGALLADAFQVMLLIFW